MITPSATHPSAIRRNRWVTGTKSGKGSGRVSIIGVIRVKAGHRSQIIYHVRLHRGRRGGWRGFAERHYTGPLDAAQRQLCGSIAFVWDSLGTHLSHATLSHTVRASIAARDRRKFILSGPVRVTYVTRSGLTTGVNLGLSPRWLGI